MILKNKVIFGTTGFLVAGGTIALAVILATSDDEPSTKAKVKTKLDVSTLSSDSFKVSGNQTLGVVNLKSDMTLPKQIELKYFVGANAPANDKSFNSNKPSNLKNRDIVYIKFFIKKASIKNYEFKNKDSNPIKFLVSGLPLKTINHSLLIKDSFVISGSQTKGKVSKKPNVTFPKQVEIKYFRGKQAPNNDKAYKLDMPTNLSNGDKVHIKFFVKKEYATTHKFADDFTNSITIPINNLPKTEIDSSLLVKGSFVISGSQTKGTISKKTSVTFPTQVEAKYFKGANAPNEDSAYQQSVPTNLNNRDIVYIKFFIKDAFKNTYKFVENGFTNPIKFVVSDLIVNNGKIALQDSNGNIWAKWKGAMLQVLVKRVDGNYASSWTTSNTSGLLNGSNITSGSLGAILEDSSGNIWAMGSSKPLQVLVKRADGTYANSWTHNTNSKLLRGSRINNGYLGVIFEDSSGNLWAMGYNSPLQVLIKNVDGNYANSWISDSTKEGLLKNSNISYGFDGVIFEDSNGNLWAMGYRKRLQVLAKDANGNYASSWINDPSQEGLLKKSNIANGYGGVIFEDSSGNIWSMGHYSPLQVLVKDDDGNYASSWINDPSQEGLLKDSNITKGKYGVIFEDSQGNIWAMGKGTPLQVLKKEGDRFASSWTNDTTSRLLNGSNITNGETGVIFEDSSGNIWAMGKGTPLQVLKKEGDKFASSWTRL